MVTKEEDKRIIIIRTKGIKISNMITKEMIIVEEEDEEGGVVMTIVMIILVETIVEVEEVDNNSNNIEEVDVNQKHLIGMFFLWLCVSYVMHLILIYIPTHYFLCPSLSLAAQTDPRWSWW